MGRTFGSNKLIKCLKILGFTYHSHSASHEKYRPPIGYPKDKRLRPFLEVQIGRKDYVQHSCSRYIGQIKAMGFTQKQIDDAFNNKS